MTVRPVTAGLLAALGAMAISSWAHASDQPNILVILADDLGYGDVHCYNLDRGRIPTPNLDRFAAQGLRFTDAHSSSGVCSPSRYSLLTGRYHWRTGRAGIVQVFGRPMIAPERLTLASLLKQHGYRTAAIGKWHLGWDWPIPTSEAALFHSMKPKGEEPPTDAQTNAWRAVFSKSIPGGPTTRGFDHYFGTDVPNWPPYCFIENDRTLGVPSVFLPPHLVGNNQASLHGPALPDWKLEAIVPTLADRACAFLEEAAKRRQPFFLYLPLTSPHTPLAVAEEWKGRSQLNDYADFVMQTDAVVGRVLDALDRSGVADNTLVVFNSDNGCASYIGAPQLEKLGHFPSGPLRGCKSDVWEGGHRIPFMVRWPGVVKPGGVSHRLVQQSDLLATAAAILDFKLPDNAGEDSVSFLPLLRGEDRPTRADAVNQSIGGLLAIRKGEWKLIFGRGSGGWTKGGDRESGQLYNLAADLGEANNLHAEKPVVVAGLTALMKKIISDGRSTPGAPQKNDAEMKWKVELEPKPVSPWLP